LRTFPTKGFLDVTQLDKPGFGLIPNPVAKLSLGQYLLNPNPERPAVEQDHLEKHGGLDDESAKRISTTEHGTSLMAQRIAVRV
jgi:hypothetical protein